MGWQFDPAIEQPRGAQRQGDTRGHSQKIELGRQQETKGDDDRYMHQVKAEGKEAERLERTRAEDPTERRPVRGEEHSGCDRG